MRFLIVVLVLLVGPMFYIRLAPTNPDRWHVRLSATEPFERRQEGGFSTARKITAPAAEVLVALERVALATPRTTLLAGSVAEGMVTFQTRSLFWGFPDHTTVAVENDLLVIHGRLRFGRRDLGVNEARIRAWIAALGPLTEAS